MRVVVLQPHTHEGQDYPPGSVLELPEDSAGALIARGAATEAEPDASSEPQTRKRNRKGD
jgi:hypothetical protein